MSKPKYLFFFFPLSLSKTCKTQILFHIKTANGNNFWRPQNQLPTRKRVNQQNLHSLFGAKDHRKLTPTHFNRVLKQPAFWQNRKDNSETDVVGADYQRVDKGSKAFPKKTLLVLVFTCYAQKNSWCNGNGWERSESVLKTESNKRPEEKWVSNFQLRKLERQNFWWEN